MNGEDKKQGPSRVSLMWKLLRGTLGPLAALVCVLVFFAVSDWLLAEGTFSKVDNLRTIAISTCVIAVAALGMTVIIISGGIDLSVGTGLALCATVMALGLERDVANMIRFGDSFAGASRAFDAAQDAYLPAAKQRTDLDARIARLDALLKDTTPDSVDYARFRSQRNALVEQQVQLESELDPLRNEVQRLRARLLAIAEAKLKETRRRAEAAQPRAEAARRLYEAASEGSRKQRLLLRMGRLEDERTRLDRGVTKNERKVAALADVDFRTDSNPEWKNDIPNDPLTAPLAALLAIATGLICGLINGVLISSLRVVPFIVTLGTMTIFMGVGNWIAANKPIRPTDADQVPFWLQDMVSKSANALWLNTFPTGVWLLLLLAAALALVLRYTVFGRYVFALGSNESTARLCGVNVPRVKISVYALAGFFVGVAGICHFATQSTGNPNSGLGLELKIIAAVVIGGGSLNGGRGAVLGTLAGAVLMQVIEIGGRHLGLDVSIQQIILGAIIVGAVTIDQIRQRRLAAT